MDFAKAGAIGLLICAAAVPPAAALPKTRTAHWSARPAAKHKVARAADLTPQLFAPTSFWNAPLAANAAIDSQSSAYVANLQRQVSQYDTYMNTTKYSTPVYRVPADQPTVHVTLDNVQVDLKAALDQVPIPPGAAPAVGTDGHMVVWQPSTDTMWEFWRATKQADGWHTVYGARQRNLSTNVGWLTENPLWGATATSLPLLGGLMRLDELTAGPVPKINHALAMALPETRAGVFVLPALRTDGNVASPTAIPEGARFRLPASLDLSKIPMTPLVRAMAEAAQKYGIVVRDRAGSVSFFGEDPTPTGTNPYAGPNGLFQGGYINQQLKQFPWGQLQALRTGLNG